MGKDKRIKRNASMDIHIILKIHTMLQTDRDNVKHVVDCPIENV